MGRKKKQTQTITGPLDSELFAPTGSDEEPSLSTLSLEDQEEEKPSPPVATKKENGTKKEANGEPSKPKISRQKRKKLQNQAAQAAKDREREQMLEELKKNSPNLGEIESRTLSQKLTPLGFSIKEIPADGNCLYAAIGDQLLLQGYPVSKDYYKILRQQASTYMLEHKEDFMPFVESSDGEMITEEGFQKYCHEVANTTRWGGHLELQGLSHALSKHIIIHQSNSPDVEIGTEYGGVPLRVSFHQYAYSLGEHYNSVIPILD